MLKVLVGAVCWLFRVAWLVLVHARFPTWLFALWAVVQHPALQLAIKNSHPAVAITLARVRTGMEFYPERDADREIEDIAVISVTDEQAELLVHGSPKSTWQRFRPGLRLTTRDPWYHSK